MDIQGSPANNCQPLTTHGQEDDIVRESLQHRRIILNSDINDSLIERVVMRIENWNMEDDDKEEEFKNYQRPSILIFINSDGGSCTDGLALISAIQQSTTPVITIAQGKAYSMGLLILCAGHIRYAYRHATMMYHQLSYGHCGTLGEHGEFLAELADKLQDRMDGILLERTRITKGMLAKVNKSKKNWYLFPEEAYTLGVIDDIVPQALKVAKVEKGRVYNERGS